MDATDFTRIGTIVNSHGIKGEVKVMPITADEDLFLEQEQFIIDRGESHQVFTVVRSRPVKHYWLIQFEEVRDIDAAKGLKGVGVCVEDCCLRPLAEDEFFIHDLIGAKVFSTDEQYLGVVTDFFDAGSQGVCEVTDEGGIFLFPVTREVLREIEPRQRVVINLLPGLVELNR